MLGDGENDTFDYHNVDDHVSIYFSQIPFYQLLRSKRTALFVRQYSTCACNPFLLTTDGQCSDIVQSHTTLP
jgi:hypothetical protein